MVCQWEPNTQYDSGCVVEFQGHRYKIIQPHCSQADWQPTVTPALWARLPQEDHHEDRSEHHHEDRSEHHHHGGDRQHTQGQNFVDQSGGPDGGFPQSGGAGYGDYNQGQKQEDKKNEHSMDEKRKHQLEIGGGVVGALAIGAGVFAYSKHKSQAKEDAKAQAWQNEASQGKWLQGAAANSQHYRNGGQSPPVYWVLIARDDPIPNNAIEGGRENGHPLYLSRVYYQSGLHIGKASPRVGGCAIGYGGKEHNDFDKFEVLVGDKHGVKWINHAEHSGNIQVQGWQPVEGGKESDGRYLFVCQVQHEGGVHPAKAQDGTDFAIFSYGGKEHTKKEFNILAYS